MGWSSKRKEPNGTRHTIRYSTMYMRYMDPESQPDDLLMKEQSAEISATSNLTKRFKAKKLYFACCYFRLCLSNTLCNAREGCGILCNFARILYLYDVMFTIEKVPTIMAVCA